MLAIVFFMISIVVITVRTGGTVLKTVSGLGFQRSARTSHARTVVASHYCSGSTKILQLPKI
jgi:hypothetical protein